MKQFNSNRNTLMKARICTAFSLALALATLPFVAGCTEDAEGLPGPLPDATNAASASATVTSNALADSALPADAEAEPLPAVDPDEVVAAPAPGAEKKQIPANLKPTPPT